MKRLHAGKANRQLLVIITSLFTLNLALLGFFSWIYVRDTVYDVNQKSMLPELTYLTEHTLTMPQLTKFFTHIAEEKNTDYAYNVLEQAQLPPLTDVHVLAHFIGDVHYKTYGAKGIASCTEKFHYGCSHSIVVGLFTDKGESALEEIATVCQNAPGGVAAYLQCFHGLGHGILVYTGYDVARTAKICQATDADDTEPYESAECIGGAIMEIVGGGFHDKTTWTQQKGVYLNTEAPLALCLSDKIPEKAKRTCFSYVTPFLAESAGGTLWEKDPAILRQAFGFCDTLPRNSSYRTGCYSGFGKEIVALALNKDTRDTEQITKEQIAWVYNQCALSGTEDGIQACITQALVLTYVRSTNRHTVGRRFCDNLPNSSVQKHCYTSLVNAARDFDTVNERLSICNEIPAVYMNNCQKQLAVEAIGS